MHPRYGTPYRITIATGVLVAVMAGVIPLGELTELVNIGTLAAFLLVSIGVIVLRRTRPDLPRAFRVPLMPVLPILSALACLWLMLNLTGNTWIRFLAWMALGFVIYFAYGRRRSRFNTPGDREDAAAANAARRRLRRSPGGVNLRPRVYSHTPDGPTGIAWRSTSSMSATPSQRRASACPRCVWSRPRRRRPPAACR